MKYRKIHVVLTIIATIFTSHCGQPDGIEQVKPDMIREFTSAFKEKSLTDFKNSNSTASANGRANPNELNRVNWNKVYKVFNTETQITTYTLPLIVDKANQFDNLIVVEKGNEQHGYIMRYKPDLEWAKNKPNKGGFDSFTGVLEIVNIEGIVEASTEYDNGKPISKNKANNGRVASCQTYIDVTWTEVCVEGMGCSVGNVTWTEYVVCESIGGGGGTSGGTTNGGGTGTTETSGGHPTGGGEGPTPIGGGDPGTMDLTDISYYLTPLNPNDDLSNPYDGMKATDKNGIVYTYDASINAWLLPDLEILSQNGYEIEFANGGIINDFEGSVLSSIVITGLTFEPTQVGKMVIGSAILTILIYEAYQIATTNLDDATRDHCSDMFYLCTTKYGYKNMDCATCQRFCNVQGYWDFNNCPLRD
ncbi:MAG: hypothetical protein ACI83W_001502 [Marinoscillum sp.]|jgi:hypothetical protein